ncbi:uncharacterized protein BEWA_049770 [Theileria equi strain WA]|uniref:Membrane protein, putative n=1 Tax=Theileria equi strain WA TaxID=1537102 RepID=L1LB58_THEEQ|nr:uncharacterized protein BEWA_049770 [Theileria equi strain WA]EKX72510.1 membrane protein, putative [Theileria equi strain WA]|eukprot:XP_004831962.1 uncharacterized protein BEWA_049770 [Theileria equi strain WA]
MQLFSCLALLLAAYASQGFGIVGDDLVNSLGYDPQVVSFLQTGAEELEGDFDLEAVELDEQGEEWGNQGDEEEEPSFFEEGEALDEEAELDEELDGEQGEQAEEWQQQGGEEEQAVLQEDNEGEEQEESFLQNEPKPAEEPHHEEQGGEHKEEPKEAAHEEHAKEGDHKPEEGKNEEPAKDADHKAEGQEAKEPAAAEHAEVGHDAAQGGEQKVEEPKHEEKPAEEAHHEEQTGEHKADGAQTEVEQPAKTDKPAEEPHHEEPVSEHKEAAHEEHAKEAEHKAEEAKPEAPHTEEKVVREHTQGGHGGQSFLELEGDADDLDVDEVAETKPDWEQPAGEKADELVSAFEKDAVTEDDTDKEREADEKNAESELESEDIDDIAEACWGCRFWLIFLGCTLVFAIIIKLFYIEQFLSFKAQVFKKLEEMNKSLQARFSKAFSKKEERLLDDTEEATAIAV